MTDRFGSLGKQEGRVKIWRTISRSIHPPLAKVLFLPGSKHYELDTVLSFGYRPENIFLVEKNPAVKANFTRIPRQDHCPKPENFLRMLVSEAAVKLKARGVTLNAAHLDFCSHCESKETFSETQKFLRSGIMKENGLLAITVLATREREIDHLLGLTVSFGVKSQKGLDRRFEQLSNQDQGRLYMLWHTVGAKLDAINFGKYYNEKTRNSMLWAIFKVQKIGGKHHEPRS